MLTILGVIEIKQGAIIVYKILSFDTSTRITGYAVYEDSKLVQYGSIDISSIKDM